MACFDVSLLFDDARTCDARLVDTPWEGGRCTSAKKLDRGFSHLLLSHSWGVSRFLAPLAKLHIISEFFLMR